MRRDICGAMSIESYRMHPSRLALSLRQFEMLQIKMQFPQLPNRVIMASDRGHCAAREHFISSENYNHKALIFNRKRQPLKVASTRLAFKPLAIVGTLTQIV